MERGLLWLPLLILFFWLAYSGWNEYQKVESYGVWSEQFEQAKYDLYAVLGYKQGEVTYGKPTRKGPVELQSFLLQDMEKIRILVGDKELDNPDDLAKGKVNLEFMPIQGKMGHKIPFTQLDLAQKWLTYLEDKRQSQ